VALAALDGGEVAIKPLVGGLFLDDFPAGTRGVFERVLPGGEEDAGLVLVALELDGLLFRERLRVRDRSARGTRMR
jgi:hypothetical protein